MHQQSVSFKNQLTGGRFIRGRTKKSAIPFNHFLGDEPKALLIELDLSIFSESKGIATKSTSMEFSRQTLKGSWHPTNLSIRASFLLDLGKTFLKSSMF